MGAAKERARRARQRDTRVGTAGEVAAGTAGMTGAIPATAAMVEERAAARAKERERAKDTPTGELTRQPKEGKSLLRGASTKVCLVCISQAQKPRIDHKLIV